MHPSTGHIEEEDLESYSRRRLSEESAARAERHLLICEDCRERLVEAEAYSTAMKYAASGLRTPDRAGKWRRWFLKGLIPASAVLVLVGAVAATWPVIRRGAAAPFAVSLRAMRGPASQATAPSRRRLLLELDLTGLAASPSYRIEIVDQLGNRVWQGACGGHGATGSVAVPAQERGTYFVRIALPLGETLREYGLEVRGTD